MIFSIFASAVLIVASSSAQSLKKNRPVMDTFASVQLPADKAPLFRELWDAADKFEQMVSREKVDSEISQINRNRSAEVSVELVQMIRRAMIFHDATNGYYNCALGTKTEDPVPDIKTLQKDPKILVEINTNRVSLKDENTVLDLERLKEGFLVDIMADHVSRASVREAVVRVGESQRCLGTCKMDLTNPFVPSEKWSVLHSKVQNLAVSSFNFQKKYLQQSELQKLIDPKTGKSVRQFAGVTILTTADNARASAFASAILLMPEGNITDVLSRYPDMAFILVYENGEIRTSSNLYDFVVSFRMSPESWGKLPLSHEQEVEMPAKSETSNDSSSAKRIEKVNPSDSPKAGASGE